MATGVFVSRTLRTNEDWGKWGFKEFYSHQHGYVLLDASRNKGMLWILVENEDDIEVMACRATQNRGEIIYQEGLGYHWDGTDCPDRILLQASKSNNEDLRTWAVKSLEKNRARRDKKQQS